MKKEEDALKKLHRMKWKSLDEILKEQGVSEKISKAVTEACKKIRERRKGSGKVRWRRRKGDRERDYPPRLGSSLAVL